MNTQAVAVKMTSPVEDFVSEVLDPARMAEVAESLPAHIKPALFQRNLLNAVMANPDLMKFSPGLIFREVSKAVSLGLFLDPQLGEAYIVPTYNYKTKQVEPQLRVGYRGLTKLARQSGDVRIVYAHEVRANDIFECVLGSEKSIIHKPIVFGDRGAVVGYYAVMKLANGEIDFEPMSLPQVRAIRDRSDGYKAFSENKIKSTPWSTDEDEMGKKTAIRRLMKRAPQSPELAEAIRIEDAAEHSFGSAPRLVPPLARLPPNPNALSPPSAPRLAAAPIAAKASPPNPNKGRPAPSEPAPAESFDFDAFRDLVSAAATQEEANAIYEREVTNRKPALHPDEVDECDSLLREACQKFWVDEGAA